MKLTHLPKLTKFKSFFLICKSRDREDKGAQVKPVKSLFFETLAECQRVRIRIARRLLEEALDQARAGNRTGAWYLLDEVENILRPIERWITGSEDDILGLVDKAA